MAREQSLESKINASTDFLGVLSLGSVVLSGILLFTPVKAIGYIGIGSGMGVFTASVISRKNHLQVARQHVDGLTKHHHSEIGLQNNLLASKDNELDTLGADKTKAFKKIEALKQELNISENQLAILQNQIDGLTAENHAKTLLIEQVNGELDRLFNLARTIIEESLSEWDTRLNSLVNTRREQYPKLTKRLEQLLEEGQQKLAEYTLKLANTPRRWDSLSDLFSIYYVCNDDLQNIRVKAVQAIAKLTNQETLIELQEYQTA
jgi:chromosome segregation ATPase